MIRRRRGSVRAAGCRGGLQQRRPMAAVTSQSRKRLSEFAHALLLVVSQGPLTRRCANGCCDATIDVASQYLSITQRIATATGGKRCAPTGNSRGIASVFALALRGAWI